MTRIEKKIRAIILELVGNSQCDEVTYVDIASELRRHGIGCGPTAHRVIIKLLQEQEVALVDSK